MPRQRRLALSSVLGIVSAGVLTGGPAASARNTMRTAFSTVRAVNVDNGKVSALTRVGAHSRYHLAVRTGAYLVVSSAIHTNGGTSDRVDRLAVVRRSAADRVAQAAGDSRVVSIGNVTLGPARGAPGVTRRVDGLVLTDLFNPLSARGITFVDTSPLVVAAAKREQKLWDDGRSATKVSYMPLKPTYEITGEGTQLKNGQVTMTLNLKNLVTGQVVASKTVTAKGKTFQQLDDLFGQLTSEFGNDAGDVIDESPTGGGVTVDLTIAFITPGNGEGAGTVTVSPPGRTFTEADAKEVSYEYQVNAGTTDSLQAQPDAGSYFVGWQSGSECGANSFESQNPQYSCTVTNPGDGHPFVINVGADFDQCPAPGTYVFNEPNATVCPGVKVVDNQP